MSCCRFPLMSCADKYLKLCYVQNARECFEVLALHTETTVSALVWQWKETTNWATLRALPEKQSWNLNLSSAISPNVAWTLTLWIWRNYYRVLRMHEAINYECNLSLVHQAKRIMIHKLILDSRLKKISPDPTREHGTSINKISEIVSINGV